MEKEYKHSRIIIAALAAIVSFIALINEDISVKVAGICLFVIVAFLCSFLGSIVSKKIIQIGDKFNNIAISIGYYCGLFLAILLMAFFVWSVSYDFIEAKMRAEQMPADIGRAVILVAIWACFFIFMIVPYLQSLVILVLRKIHKTR